jgi:hypothetical protein
MNEVAVTLENSPACSKKLSVYLPHNLVITLLAIYYQEMQTSHKNLMWMFIYDSQRLKKW